MTIRNATLLLYAPHEVPLINGNRMDPALDGVYTKYTIDIKDDEKFKDISKAFIQNDFDFTEKLHKLIAPAWAGMEMAIFLNKEDELELEIGNYMGEEHLGLPGKFKITFIQKMTLKQAGKKD